MSVSKSDSFFNCLKILDLILNNVESDFVLSIYFLSCTELLVNKKLKEKKYSNT